MIPNSMNIAVVILFLVLSSSLHHSLALLHARLDNRTDQDALFSFKSHIIEDPNRALDAWNSNTSLSSWHGVVYNPQKNRITGLMLGNLSLSGTLSPYIANLSFLRVLDLGNNSFHGIIPTNFAQLFRLETLILASNNIHGTIPSSLSSCTRLVLLDLSENRLEGAIPSELGNLKTLQDLSFGKNNLTGSIPSSFGNFTSLENLILRSNKLQGPIPSELGHLNRLLQLNLGDNYFSGEIPSSLFNLSSLIILSLAKNQISGYLPSDLFLMLPNLTTLFVGGNLFQGHIPVSLSNATNLQKLDLSTNRLVGHVPLLWNLPNVQILNLEINQLVSEGEHGLDFITSLTNSSLLQVFSLATNQFTGQLPSSISNLSSQLSLLVMGENHFVGNVPAGLGNLRSLILLSLASNSFTGNIPTTIGNLHNLQSLFLDLNLLTGSIPDSLGNLSQLYEMGLSRNNLTGSIPSSLSNCQHLQFLDISMNKLGGNIPKEIFSFPSLGTLVNFSWNSLTGPLPSEIGNLKMVQGIDISNNKLSGAIPSSIGDCSNLMYLDLSSNNFQGLIPDSFSNLKGTEYIDLSYNNLSGQIPSLDTLIFLRILNLSDNELQGEVPEKGIFLNTSGVFLSGNPELCGGIPKLDLPKCSGSHGHSGRSKKIVIVGIVTSLAALSVIIVLGVLLFKKRKKAHNHSIKTDVITFEGPHRLYTYYDLKSATNDFSDENLIGRGSFGSVYKGVLGDGNLAAIKVFNLNQRGASKSFLAECEAFRNIRHRNLVKILSVSSTSNFKALVLQFMPNGNLERWIHQKDQDQRPGLTAKQRLDIAADVASAMEYLHHECETPVVHCDLKPSNILLDEDMTAHVGDFGLARMLFGSNFNPHQSSTIGLKGSIGYIAPEYGFGGGVSRKGDVYSYGILLLEMLTGKKPNEEMFCGDLNLQKWVGAAVPDRVVEIFDDELVEYCKVWGVDHFVSVIQIGLLCASEAPEKRPEMKDVSAMIRRTRGMISSDAT